MFQNGWQIRNLTLLFRARNPASPYPGFALLRRDFPRQSIHWRSVYRVNAGLSYRDPSDHKNTFYLSGATSQKCPDSRARRETPCLLPKDEFEDDYD
jgi:hypothetical protein